MQQLARQHCQKPATTLSSEYAGGEIFTIFWALFLENEVGREVRCVASSRCHLFGVAVEVLLHYER